jgi:hypothetical protein
MLPYGIVTLFLLFTLAVVAINVVLLVWHNGWITFLHFLSAFEGNAFFLLILFFLPGALIWSLVSNFQPPRSKSRSKPKSEPPAFDEDYSIVPILSGDPGTGEPRESQFKEAEI